MNSTVYIVTLIDLLQQYRDQYPHETLTSSFVEFAQRQSRCLDRTCYDDGHFTVSAWLVNPSRDRCLLTHHRKLNKWLQLGGHIEMESNPLYTATREVKEESGLSSSPLRDGIFDIDLHTIPQRGSEPAHFHYDLRFLLEADNLAQMTLNEESHELRWFRIDEVGGYTQEESIARMVRKHNLELRRKNVNIQVSH